MTLARLSVRAAAERRKCWPGAFIIKSDMFVSDVMRTHIVVNDIHIAYDDKSDISEDMMETDWPARVKGLLKSELKKKNVGYRQLAELLTAMGIPETEPNIANKISRGGFTAVFFVQCLVAIGAHTVRLHDES
jgi:hypothetical protein